ncbi:MAG: hypothetical protein AB7E46_01525 [Desulfovibrio sp.]
MFTAREFEAHRGSKMMIQDCEMMGMKKIDMEKWKDGKKPAGEPMNRGKKDAM